MTTVATAVVKQLAHDWQHNCGYQSAVLSGIVGDRRHRGGYHRSREDNPRGNYSIIRPDDKWGNGPDGAAAAIDMNMNEADMRTCTLRLRQLYTNVLDPRRKYLNAFNGWLGSGDAMRWDIYGRRVEAASSDHKWHMHLELRRRYVNSRTAAKAIFSALKGEPLAMYLDSIGVKLTIVNSVPAYPGHVLSRNDKQRSPDPAVRLWQQRMVHRGWRSMVPPDGFFGPKTEAAVKNFQRTCRVKPDGKIGPVTWPLPWTRPIAS